jgi:hypothetical protein
MKTLILILGCVLLLVIPSQAAEKQPEQTQQQLKDHSQQLEEIEKYIASLHQGIENYYTNQLIEVKQNSQAEIGLLEVADKPVYASLAGQAEVAKTVLHINNYGYRAPWYLEAKTERMLQLKDDFDEHESYGDFEDSIKESPKRFTMAHSSSIAETAEITDGNSTSGSTSGSTSTLAQSWIDDGDFADIIKRSPKRFAVAQSLIAERKSEILAKLEFETADLERQKNYALTVTLPELEKRLKQDLLKPEPTPTHGLVTGIVYSADKPSAIVDRKIVHEGDVIYGATVVKIYRDSVKFGNKGKNWEQKVQQTPESYWK